MTSTSTLSSPPVRQTACPTNPAFPDDAGCPRCGSTHSWGMASWCPGCGYYPTVESADEDRMAWRAEIMDAAVETDTVAEANLWNCVPLWMWPTVAGVMAIFGVSVVASKAFGEAAETRSFWAWTELIAGFSVACAAHVSAAWIAKRSDVRMTLIDTLLNWMAVWQPTISRLPKHAWRVWCFVWGLTAIACSLVIIGGHDTSMFFKDTYEPPGSALPTAVNSIAEAAKANARPADSLEDALRQVGDPEDGVAKDAKGVDGESDQAADGSPPEMLCAIFGVQLNPQGQPTHFLLMGRPQGHLQFVAIVKTSAMDQSMLATVARRLTRTSQPRPEVPTRYAASWVQPRIACRVKSSGISAKGIPANPQITEILEAEWDADQDLR